MPKITVYIASHNYGRFVGESIESVLRQTYDDWELLLFNDNSSDNTDQVYSLYENDERIKIINTTGVGLTRIANMATQNSTGDYLIRLDGDDIFDENILLVLSNYLDRNVDVGLVFPDYYLIDESGGIFSEERRAEVYHNNHILDVPAHGACTMIRKTVLQEIGGYREDLGAQDGFDVWVKSIRAYKAGNVNLPLFYYRRHGSNLTGDKSRIFNARRAIKKDASLEQLAGVSEITAVIPCREKYDIYQDIWNIPIDAKRTLLDIAMQRCIESSLFKHIVILSDTDKVLKTMQKYDDQRLKFVQRSVDSTIRSKPVTISLNNVIDELGLVDNGIMLMSYIQAPFVSLDSMEESVYTLLVNNADSSFAVEEIEHSLYKRSPHGLSPINNLGRLKSEFDIIYSDSSTSLATRNKNVKSGSLLGSTSVNFVVPKKESFFIHTKEDLEIARILFKLQNKE